MKYIFPPYNCLFKIARDIPKTMFLYIQLWNKREHSNIITVHKKNIRIEYFMETDKFRRELTILAKGQYLDWDEDEDGNFYIELPEVEIDGKDNCLC